MRDTQENAPCRRLSIFVEGVKKNPRSIISLPRPVKAGITRIAKEYRKPEVLQGSLTISRHVYGESIMSENSREFAFIPKDLY